MTLPLVTVLMPVYNGGEYLELSVSSILMQTFSNFELLIVDDCSTDESLNFIQSINDSRIVIHRNERNFGQTKTLNVGLKLAKGKYIARMDADDLAYPDWLKTLVSLAEKMPTHVAIGTGAIVINDKGQTKERRIAPTSWPLIIFTIFFAPPMNHVSVILNKEMILHHGGYDEQFTITQDYELWSSLIRKGHKLANTSAVLVAYRVHEQSLGAQNSKGVGLKEKAETLFRNVSSMTDLSMSRERALRIMKFFYDSSTLSQEEFFLGRSDFELIFTHLKETFPISKPVLESGVKRQVLKAYSKKSVSEFMAGNPRSARHLCADYYRRYGFHIIPPLIFAASFVSRNAVLRLPKCFERFREIIGAVAANFWIRKCWNAFR